MAAARIVAVLDLPANNSWRTARRTAGGQRVGDESDEMERVAITEEVSRNIGLDPAAMVAQCRAVSRPAVRVLRERLSVSQIGLDPSDGLPLLHATNIRPANEKKMRHAAKGPTPPWTGSQVISKTGSGSV